MITGGEPLLNSDHIEIIKSFTNLGIKTDLVTNGTMLNEDKIIELEKSGLKRLRISIDGFKEHERYRGSDPCRLWKLVEFSKKNTNMNICVHTVCALHNVESLNKIYDNIVRTTADRWRVFDIGFQGGVITNKEKIKVNSYYNIFASSVREILKLYLCDNELKKRLDIEIGGFFKTKYLRFGYDAKLKFNSRILDLHPCQYIWHQATIRSNGKLTYCQYFNDPIIDFKRANMDINAALKRKKVTSNCNIKIKDIIGCNKCKYLGFCFAVCRSRAKYLTGDIYKADPVSCVLAELFYEQILPLLNQKTQIQFKAILRPGEDPLFNNQDLDNFIYLKYLKDKI